MKTAEEWFDENQANYKGIKSRHYAIQMAHTNNIECFWSHLKRGIDGGFIQY